MLEAWAWPVITLIIVILLLDPIKSFLYTFSKSKRIKFPFLDIEIAGLSNQAIYIQSENESKQEPFLKAFQNSLITEEEKSIRDKLVEAQFTTEKAIAVLIYQFANINLHAAFLWIDKYIFLEQKKLLKRLNTGVINKSETEVISFYETWQMRAHTANLSRDAFLGYLINHNLMYHDHSGYRITIKGKEYLKFLVSIGEFDE